MISSKLWKLPTFTKYFDINEYVRCKSSKK